MDILNFVAMSQLHSHERPDTKNRSFCMFFTFLRKNQTRFKTIDFYAIFDHFDNQKIRTCVFTFTTGIRECYIKIRVFFAILIFFF